TAFERIAETEERIAARLYLALDAPLLREYEAFLNDPDEARLRALAALALEDVLIELAFESGRAAAQRARGEAL
ncbi:MAG: hypothetical protein Q4F71_12055, partial [Paracoccus sp. (in: a-proteobacteria)]|nr:hypothetical protein [Paracoccus sp. (in: a-proteobacteria)]